MVSESIALTLLVFGIAIILALFLVLALGWAYFTAHRLDRLHIRTDLAAAALWNAFGRRHTVAVALSEALRPRDGAVADWLLTALALARKPEQHIEYPSTQQTPGAKNFGPRDPKGSCKHGCDQFSVQVEQAENELTRALLTVNFTGIGAELCAEARDAADRLVMARSFYNDAVRDTRRVRQKPVVRLFRLAGQASLPEFIELADPSYN